MDVRAECSVMGWWAEETWVGVVQAPPALLHILPRAGLSPCSVFTCPPRPLPAPERSLLFSAQAAKMPHVAPSNCSSDAHWSLSHPLPSPVPACSPFRFQLSFISPRAFGDSEAGLSQLLFPSWYPSRMISCAFACGPFFPEVLWVPWGRPGGMEFIPLLYPCAGCALCAPKMLMGGEHLRVR